MSNLHTIPALKSYRLVPKKVSSKCLTIWLLQNIGKDHWHQIGMLRGMDLFLLFQYWLYIKLSLPFFSRNSIRPTQGSRRASLCANLPNTKGFSVCSMAFVPSVFLSFSFFTNMSPQVHVHLGWPTVRKKDTVAHASLFVIKIRLV